MQNIKFIDILLIEDKPGNILLTQEVLKNTKMINKVHVVTEGREASDFFLKRENNQNENMPDLIILDMNLPKKDGMELLAELKENHKLKKLPVVILTSSNTETEILKSYNFQACYYITKPIDLEKFIHVVLSIEDFWLSVVTLHKYSD
jgi:CheY-like chemotaxis protein